MYNYLSSIFLLFVSINYGLTFTLACSSIYNYYHQNTKNNASKLAFFLSLYLFGFTHTFIYSLFGLLGCILYNYDNVINKISKLKNDANMLIESYEKDKINNPEKVSRDIDFIQRIIKKYDSLISKIEFYKSALVNDHYYQMQK